MKILVTGGSGFIGSNLVSELAKNHEVVVFDNGFRAGFNNTKSVSDILVVKGDVTNKQDWKQLPNDIDFVFHLAAINGTKYFYEMPLKVLQVNVTGILNFIDWIQNTSAKKFFFASSSEVYGFPQVFPTPETEPLVIPDPTNPRFSYSSSKIIGETLSVNFAKTSGIDFVIGRFHNVYGPRMGFEHVIPEFIRKCVKNETFVVQGDGTESRCFCFVNDAIEALTLIMAKNEARNQIFNIGTTEEIRIKDIISLIEILNGTKIDPVYQDFKNAGTKKRVPDIKKIQKLGFKPKISFKKGLQLTYDWYAEYFSKFNE